MRGGSECVMKTWELRDYGRRRKAFTVMGRQSISIDITDLLAGGFGFLPDLHQSGLETRE